MPRRACLALILGILVVPRALIAQVADRSNPAWLLPMPEIEADPKVPTLKQTIGHGWAQEISSHSEIEKYLRALATAAPDRTRLTQYGETNEKRGLFLLVISAPKNIVRLEEIRETNLKLADPRRPRPNSPKPFSAQHPPSSGSRTECTVMRSPPVTLPS